MASVSHMSSDKQQKTEMSQRSKSKERKLSFDKALGFDMTTLKVQSVSRIMSRIVKWTNPSLNKVLNPGKPSLIKSAMH